MKISLLGRFAFRLALATLALVAANPAQAQQWWRAETNNFIIISQDSEEETRRFASELERFDMALRTLQNLPIGEEQPSPATKLTVFRFGTTSDIGRMAGSSGVAGFYIAIAGESIAFTPAREERRRTMSVTDVDRSRAQRTRLDEVSVLQHEYVHYFMMQHFPAAYPSWYVEGYAELLATIRFNDDGSFHVGDPPQYRSDQIFNMSAFHLDDMLDSTHELSGREAYQFYGTGWLFTHYLNFNPQRLAQLNEYLIAINAGEDSLEAGRRIFGDLDAIDRELLRYRNGPFPGYDVRPANYVAPVVEMRALSATEADLIMDEMRLRRGTDHEEAGRMANALAGGRHADTPLGLTLLARAQTNARDYAAAFATAERLVALAPDNIEGPLLASYNAARLSMDDAAWVARAVEYAEDAQMIDPFDPRPSINYFYAYYASGQEVPEAAIIALENVFDTAGTDTGYRVLLARQLMFENRLPEARTVLQPIAFRGHNQGDPFEDEDEDDADDPTLDKIMAFIEQNNRDAALSMMDDLLDDRDEFAEANS